ncbi:hypothetical protein Pelo_9646 [Pelomyxa schiedti]|nr:hypothetical protein Pelo_9646 [Pelomyxa schiedti]
MIIFGGIGDNSERLNDLWVFDCSSYDWTKPATRGAIPPPTRGHSAALINDGMFVCCSDLASPTTMALFRLDLKSYEWRRISVANSPPAREFATMISTDSGALILSGGRALSTGTTEKTHGDAWILHMYFNVFEFLPQELWMHVFSLCDPRTLFLLSAVCHHFSQMVSSDSLWERFILKELLNFRYELLPLKTFFRTSLAFHMYYAGTKFDEWMWLP